MRTRRTVRQLADTPVPRAVNESATRIREAAEAEERAFYGGRVPNDRLEALHDASLTMLAHTPSPCRAASLIRFGGPHAMRRTLLITGASSGIGASLVRRFAGEYDEVIAAARRVDRMRDEYTGLPTVTPMQVDVSRPEELTAFARDIVAERGSIPYVISCAGSWNPKPLLDASPEELAYGWRVDALAHAILLRELVPAMREHDFGRVVIFSGSATLVRTAGWSIQYGAVMACNGYTVAAALENHDQDVKINLTGPGAANTEMYPGPLPATACHPTVEWLLNLDQHGPTGRFFWLGNEIPMFPGFERIDFETGEVDEAHSTPLDRVIGDEIRGRSR